MSRRWWKNERSALAAAVRATRRRLRSAYRNAAVDAREKERARYLFALAEERRGIHKTQERLARLMRQVGMIRVTQERDVCSRDLIVRVSIADALLMRADSKSLTVQLAEHIARGVQREVEALDIEAARASARSRFVWPKPTEVRA